MAFLLYHNFLDCSRGPTSSRFPDAFLTLDRYTGVGKNGGGIVNPAPEGAKEPDDYQSYLLRLWRVSDGEEPTWRASLQSSRSGEQMGFDSLEELVEYLRWRTGLTASETARKSAALEL
jgi:hypothetical protein